MFERDGDALVGTFGVGLAGNYFEVIGRPLAAFFTSRLQAGTSEFAAETDRDGDGIVSLTEFADSALIRATLLNPDLDLLGNGDYDLGPDGVPESLSFSFSIRAEPTRVRWPADT